MSAETEKQVVISYLERERDQWLPSYRRAKRAAGMSGEANAESAKGMERIDALLDELSAIALSQTVELPHD